MQPLDVSLITYTYNDGHFVDGLLDEISSWTHRPSEIVIFDDGSSTAYSPPPTTIPTRVFRHDTNRGITVTKHEAISAGSSRFLLAMDCDTRISPNWLETNLAHVQQPDIGMVSGPVIYLSGNDLVSRFQRYFGDNHNLEKTGPVDFIPGNAFLMRREIWEQCEGMAGHHRNVCEDHFLCQKIKQRGLKLWIDAKARARQIRRINRIAMLKRYWKWCHAPIKKEAEQQQDIPRYLQHALITPHADRLKFSIEREELLFIYIEMLYASFIVLDVLDHLILNNRQASVQKAAWWFELSSIVRQYPLMYAVLRSDLAQLGQTPVPGWESSQQNPWSHAFEALRAIEPSGVYDWLNRSGIPSMLAEEESLKYDFSFYEDEIFCPSARRS
jgi:glycosyltransferase involved in cell wall biosynthesis